MREEIESTVDLWVTRLMRGEDHQQHHHLSGITSGAAAFTRPQPQAGTVESWKRSRPSQQGGSPKSKSSGASPSTPAPLLAIGTSARTEMLLERLPYMVSITRSRHHHHLYPHGASLAIRDMEKVTLFRGIGAPASDADADSHSDSDETPPAATEQWATDLGVGGDSPPPKKKEKKKNKKGREFGLVIRDRGGGRGVEQQLLQQQQQQKLVLSDDDIEDD